VRFAVIGDYGGGGQAEQDVANLVQSWEPDLVITTGDNNYPTGEAATIDRNIGQYYHQFIAPYTGSFGEGAEQNRFFPSPGNHDWDTPGLEPYLNYFTLPGNERYYDFTWGPVHFFAIDSDSREPDGVSSSSIQAAWLQERLVGSSAPWKIVYGHHPPYSSGIHGPIDWMRWPFKEWGATAYLASHDHTYERLLVDGFPYFVNGVGGAGIYDFEEISEGSQVRYNDDYGAILVKASQAEINFQFINRQGEIIDTYSLSAPAPNGQAPVPAAPIDQTLALLPAAQGDLASLPALPRYTLQLAVDYEALTFSGHAQVETTNLENLPLESLYFRLFPNGKKSYGDGSLTVSKVTADDQPVQAALSLSDTVLEVRLPHPLDVSESVRVDFDFEGVIPVDFGSAENGSGYGIYNFSEEVLALSGWYPILAVYDEDGWNLDPVSNIGDSVFSDMALYTVDITLDSDLVLAASGTETDRQGQGDETRYRFVSGPARDFFLAASPFFQVSSQIVDGTEINAFTLPDHEPGGQKVLSVAGDSLRTYNQLFGAYPYTELDVVDGPMRNASGVEYPGIVMIASHHYNEPDSVALAVTVAHEVAHQWWYHLVGNDVIDEPWLDEALTTYSSALYFQYVLGEGNYQGYIRSLEGNYNSLVEQGRDDLVTQGLDYFENSENSGVYGAVVYVKGALFFKEVRQAIGDAAFFAALQNYYRDRKYKVAAAEDLLAAFESASGRSLDDLYETWLYSRRVE
jgi:hypothetical protein